MFIGEISNNYRRTSMSDALQLLGYCGSNTMQQAARGGQLLSQVVLSCRQKQIQLSSRPENNCIFAPQILPL